MAQSRRKHATIGSHLRNCGYSRREFLEFCSRLMIAAPAGLAITNSAKAADVARELAKARRPSVIWLQFQDCTGCTETLLRTSEPDLGDLILQLISLDYHETLMAASGAQAEQALQAAMKENAGSFVLVCEGSVPHAEDGNYLRLAGRPGLDVLREVSAKAAAVIAIGSCASWGGVPSSGMNPTGARGVDSVVTDKPIVAVPGCPPNPYVFLAVVLQYARTGTLPDLDGLHRPKFAYDQVIHEQCPRRPHFDAGRFVQQFGDDGHRSGWCLYKMGCKGPVTHAACPTRHFCDVVDAWPIGGGSPCVGCTEQGIVFGLPIFQTVPIHQATPPDTYAPIYTPQGYISPVATGVAGLIGGALIGAGYMASKKLGPPTEREPGAGTEKE